MDRQLVALAGGFVLAGAAAIYWSVQKAPAPASMTAPDTADVQAGAPLAQVKRPASLSAQAQIGERAYNAKCAACHGENAAGQNGVAPPLVHQIYRPGHHADAAFLLAARNGVRSHHWRFGDMPPVEGVSQAEVKNIVAFIRELQRENGIL